MHIQPGPGFLFPSYLLYCRVLHHTSVYHCCIITVEITDSFVRKTVYKHLGIGTCMILYYRHNCCRSTHLAADVVEPVEHRVVGTIAVSSGRDSSHLDALHL